MIEGADLSGKTTIVEKLVRATGFKSFDWFSKILKERHFKTWMDHIDLVAEVEYHCLKQCQGLNLILDRSIISSIIYNRLYERNYDTSYINFDDFKNVYYVYISVDKDTLLKRINERYEDEIIKEKILKIRQAYEDFFKKEMNKQYLHLDGNIDPEINVSKIYKEVITMHI